MELKEMEIRNPRNEGFESPRVFFNRCRTRRVQQIASFFSISAHGLMGGLWPGGLDCWDSWKMKGSVT